MNSRKLYREYLKSNGLDCKEFISLEDEWYTEQIITYKDSKGSQKRESICVKDMLKWVFSNFNNQIWEGYIGEKD